MSRNQKLLVIVGLLISVVFVWVAFSRLNPAAVWNDLRQAQFGWLLVGVVVWFASMLAIAWRWGFLLRSADRRLSLAQLSELVAIGYMGNNVYPLRAGEILRVVLTQRSYGIGYARTTTTILVERVFDGIVLLSFVIVPLLFIDLGIDALRPVAAAAAAVFIPALIVFLFLATQPALLRRFIQLVARLLPGKLGEVVRGLGDDVITGLAGLRNPVNLLGTVFASYLSWAIYALVFHIVAIAFGIEVNYGVTLLMVGVVNLAGLIPASPGQIGIYELFIPLILEAVGIGATRATAYALAVHIVIWLPVTLLGFALLARRGLGLSAITRARDLEAAETAAQHG